MTLFGSQDLAARIERAESRLCSDSTTQSLRRGVSGAFVQPLAGGSATFAGPGAPFNKVAGLGFGGPLAERELAAVEVAYAERGTPVRVELSCLGDPAVGRLLSRRGYELHGFENVLGQRLPAATASDRLDVQVSVSPPEERRLWLDTVVEGFAHPDEQGVLSDESFPREVVEAALGDMEPLVGFSRHLAHRGGVVAGAASLRVSEGVAILCGAATRPEHRRRGVQTALLAERLRLASGAGCDVAVVTTQPGSKSQENAQKRGFFLLYARAVLVKEP